MQCWWIFDFEIDYSSVLDKHTTNVTLHPNLFVVSILSCNFVTML
jgi:hypothetical protein